ncbi:cysteine hydrolase family protein [Pelagibius sp.]|uniref:cysteine hydrolase family protein n=1 Tax=Pelagibius sp. TaxID=1931238 RepID=UPI00263420D7|nr:isochorismatase family cysteine hydrolase [Pelagibius sp.]
MPAGAILTRDLPLDPQQSALLIVDVQNYCVRRDGGELTHLSPEQLEADYGAYFRRMESVTIPKMQRLRSACRGAEVEVLYTTIESLTRDGRDRSLDYKISGFNIPKGSWEGRVVDALMPAEDEIVLPKSSSSVFISTNIDYVLRNLGIKQLAICGIRTDHCVQSAVRDACDLGYLVTLVTDACTAFTEDRHESALDMLKGYCRQVTTSGLLAELRAEVPAKAAR